MRLAGINPLLAGQHEASSPAGASATMQSAIGAGISSAQQAAAMANQIKKTKAEVQNIQAGTAYTQSKDALIGPGSFIAKNLENIMKGVMGGNADNANIAENLTGHMSGGIEWAAGQKAEAMNKMRNLVQGDRNTAQRRNQGEARLRNELRQEEAKLKLYKNEDTYTTRQIQKRIRNLKLAINQYRKPGQ